MKRRRGDSLVIKYINNEDRDKFNDWINKHPKGHFLQTYEWGEVKEKTGWKAIRIILEDQGGIKGAASLLLRDIPYIGKKIVYIPRGPIVDYQDINTMKILFNGIKEVAKKNNGAIVKIDPDIEVTNEIVTDNLKKLGLKGVSKGKNFEGIQPKFVFRLPINKDIESIFGDFHSKTRYNIRLAERKGVTVREANSKEDLQVFYEVLKETAERDNFLIREYSYYEIIWDLMVQKGIAKLYLAEFEDKIIAGTLFFIFGRITWYIYGASSNSYRNVMPNYLLQWKMIKFAKEKGCDIYDFRGISGDLNPDNPLYGLYRFKKGFNPEMVEFIGEFDMVISPLHYSLWKYGEPMYRSIRKKVRGLLKRG
jgi:lipid II:glycine glycyltransferase (peptidoglycan interpeptide bridge formation enzyme)